MRSAILGPVVIIALLGSGLCASGETAPALTSRPLILIATMVQELHELRVNTGQKAVLADGTMSAVYETKIPRDGNTYLNFHVSAASEGGSFVLESQSIRLVGVAPAASVPRVDGPTGKVVADAVVEVAYTPMDWFIDTGLEVRGDSLTVNDKGIVQFTIEAPRSGLDDLILFVHSQRVGTVKEIREQVAKSTRIQ